MANGDVFQCSIVGAMGTIQTVNTFHYVDQSGGSTEIDTTAFATAFMPACAVHLTPMLNNDWASMYCRVACIAGPNKGDVGYFYDATHIGALAGNAMPPEIAISLKRQTGHASRSSRGRLFIGPTTDDLFNNVEQGQILTTAAAFTGMLAFMKAGFTIDSVGLIPVLSNKLGVVSKVIINTSVAPGCVHHKTRRLKGLAV